MNFDIKNYDGIDPFTWSIGEDYYYVQMLGWMYAQIYDAYKELGDYKNAHETYVLWEKAKRIKLACLPKKMK